MVLVEDNEKEIVVLIRLTRRCASEFENENGGVKGIRKIRFVSSNAFENSVKQRE
jgi:hypothetical protein